jgi:hypothetical protein
MRAEIGKCNRTKRFRTVLSTVPWLVLAGAVPAQEVKPIAVTDISGHVELGMEGDIQERERPNSSWDSEKEEFHESVRLDIEGYMYHPRLLTFEIGSLVDYMQDQFSGDGSEDSGNTGLQIDGNWHIDLLREHPYSLSIRGQRGEQNVSQPFGRNYKSENESNGVSLRVSKGLLPFQVSFDRSSVKGSGTGSDINETTDEFQARTHYNLWDRSSGHIQYIKTQTDTKAFNRKLDRQQFLLNDTTLLNTEGTLRLNGSAQINDQSGLSDSTQFSAQESLSWRHSDTLDSRYQIAYNRADVGSQSTRIWNLGTSMSHRLYESLHTYGELHGTHENAAFGKTATSGGSLRETYAKRLGRWGSLGLAVQGSIEDVDRQPQQDTAFVFDETHFVQTGIPFELRNPDVEQITISVTDDRGVILYRPFVDYLVNTRGIYTEIQPLLTGSIPDSSTVLVDYEYDLRSRGKIRTTGGLLSANLELGEWLSLYARNHVSNQRLLTGTDDSRLDDLNRKTIGGSLAWQWLATGAEYEHKDSVFSGAESMREWATLTVSPAIGWQVQLAGRYGETRFIDTAQRLTNMSGYAMLRGRINRFSELDLSGDYQIQRWDRANDTNDSDAYGVEMAYVWRYRKLIFQANGRTSRIDQNQQNDTRYEFELSLRREF